MDGFERFMAFQSGRILNRKQPEATAIEAYRMYEFSQFMAMAGLLPKGSVCTSNPYTALAANEETTEQASQESFNLLEGKRPSLQVEMGEDEQVSLQSQGMTCTSAIKYFHAMREHPRCQKYTCRDIDLDKPIVSSVVAGLFTTGGTLSNKLEQGYLFFGRISYFLQCKGIDGKMEDYARVEWYEAPIPAEVKGLWKRCSQLW
ncbi:uncharacterized protein LOC119735844 [Patiria miniata]|uniref:Uncharacterized protein n=1 Tax=Patiria miniata TaxID=46514 RepID=A0A914ANV9_PATMI|nr:uncharacterized protein LOC119735844 [Patiria miniata]